MTISQKKCLVLLLAAVLALGMLYGCHAANAADPEKIVMDPQTAAPWLPEGTPVTLSETKALPELAEVIAETYQIPQEAWQDTRYYYSYVDLNNDGEQEIFAVVMGTYTSGSGGDSALLVLPYAGMTVSQTFTLIRTPVFVSDSTTNGARDLIFQRSGGGAQPELVKLTNVDGVYSNPADAEVLESLDGLTGTAILGNDLLTDMEQGRYLTLADR